MEGEELFDGVALAIYRTVAAVVTAWEEVSVSVARTQVSFRRPRRGFAYCWDPGLHVRTTVPLVVSVALPEKVDHPRIKEVAHPGRTTWMHHIEITGPGEIDDLVLGLLRRGWEAAA